MAWGSQVFQSCRLDMGSCQLSCSTNPTSPKKGGGGSQRNETTGSKHFGLPAPGSNTWASRPADLGPPYAQVSPRPSLGPPGSQSPRTRCLHRCSSHCREDGGRVADSAPLSTVQFVCLCLPSVTTQTGKWGGQYGKASGKPRSPEAPDFSRQRVREHVPHSQLWAFPQP